MSNGRKWKEFLTWWNNYNYYLIVAINLNPESISKTTIIDAVNKKIREIQTANVGIKK